MLTLTSPETARDVLRHVAATLAYRAAKVLRDVPDDFHRMSVASSARQPVEIVAHMADLMGWGTRLVRGEYLWKPEGGDDWATEVRRFFDGLAALDRELAATVPSAESTAQLIQGPLADAFTHVGQLAMLRGMHGSAVRPESYARAEIVAGRVGLEQAAPVREFDGDASRGRRG